MSLIETRFCSRQNSICQNLGPCPPRFRRPWYFCTVHSIPLTQFCAILRMYLWSTYLLIEQKNVFVWYITRKNSYQICSTKLKLDMGTSIVIIVRPAIGRSSKIWWYLTRTTDAQRGNSLHCTAENSIQNPKIFGTAEACFVCHIGPIFQISLIHSFRDVRCS